MLCTLNMLACTRGLVWRAEQVNTLGICLHQYMKSAFQHIQWSMPCGLVLVGFCLNLLRHTDDKGTQLCEMILFYV
jgi:hypothetical protein